MTYEKAMRAYLGLRTQLEQKEAAHKAEVAAIKSQMVDLETWITMKAGEDGTDTVKNEHGTVYWSTHASATVASRDAFMTFVKENDAFELLENRVSKAAVKAYMEANDGLVPPGVNFTTVRVFNLRKAGAKE
jgi:hypothetical protein